MSESKRQYSEIKLARGIFFHQGHVLLVKNKLEGGHYFLPGGKVDAGESVLTSLSREFQEELAWAVRPQQFLGCYEHAWQHPKKNGVLVDIIEINFLWTCERLDSALSLQNPASMEDKIGFEWVALDRLDSLYLLPSEFKEILPRLHRDLNQGSLCPFWGTSMKPVLARH